MHAIPKSRSPECAFATREPEPWRRPPACAPPAPPAPPQSLAAVIAAILLGIDVLFDESSFVFEPSFAAWQRRTGALSG